MRLLFWLNRSVDINLQCSRRVTADVERLVAMPLQLAVLTCLCSDGARDKPLSASCAANVMIGGPQKD